MKTTIPNCKGCRKAVVAADAGILRSIPYWYCRTCKVEVDDWGREVFPKKTKGLEDLEDYLSVETGRWENESQSDQYINYYDPFLKLSRKITKFEYEQIRSFPLIVPEPEEEGDDEILGYW